MTQLFAPWPHLSMTNVIDIVLVAVVVYQFLMLVRGTRAAPTQAAIYLRTSATLLRHMD